MLRPTTSPGAPPEPSRAAGLARLAAFAPRMGRAYAEGRNHDPGPGAAGATSGLSPYLRHRLLTEHEAIGTALTACGADAAGRFIQEVAWRCYWKGWLEQRPGVWDEYRRALAAAPRPPGLHAAMEGRTGIACFDAWAEELVTTNTLHNHARMWAASIWIFTLRLPWELGADWFLRHLRDGDAASNTLSWRWVAGLQTRGKHYVARAANIATWTGGRFDPRGALVEHPSPLDGPPPPPARPLAPADAPPRGRIALLLHEDDLHPESLDLGGSEVAAIAGLAVPEARSPAGCAPAIADWTRAALADGLTRAGQHFGCAPVLLAQDELAAWAGGTGCAAVATPWAPVGWTAQALAATGVQLLRLRRAWDSACWPLATRGFFPFRAELPGLFAQLRPAPPGGRGGPTA